MLATPELIQEAAQVSRLRKLLPRWREVPMYRNSLGQLDFSQLPVITKREIRDGFPQNFLGANQSLEVLLENKIVELEHTSGTSDERTPVLFGRGWWNEQEATVLRLNSIVAKVLDENPNARRATLTPPICNGLVCFSNWHSRSARTLDQTLFVNLSRIPFLLSEAELDRMAGEISDWSPTFLDLDPVHGAWFALYCERKGIRFPSLKFILCSYEFVSVVHRRIIQRVFNVPVFNLYGSTETGHLLIENERDEMKASYENVFYEIAEADERGIGHLIVTTLTNDFMPLVRYRVGDLVQRREEPYATNYLVHGPARDTMIRSDGHLVTTLEIDQCFQGIDGIAHYQLRQNEKGNCRLQFIPGRELNSASLSQTITRLQELLQLSNPVSVEQMSVLPPTPSGKFRLTQRD